MSFNQFVVICNIAGMALGISIGGCLRNNTQDKRLDRLESRKIISICTGCKSEFYDESSIEYIEKCPNCPMSDEEFKKLIGAN